MSSFGRTRDFPEALINILMTIINRTPDGGATMDELKEAYQNIKGTSPHERTIRRNIQRLNELFDPLAYEDPVASEPLAIQGALQNGTMRYRFTRDLISRPVDPSAAFLMAMSIYPQQRSLLGNQFEVVMKLIFEEILSKLTTVYSLYDEIEKYVHVTGASPVEPEKNFTVIDKILQAIRLQKRVKIQYFRTYDATLTNREIEPYGLLCRSNNWYLTGRCCEKKRTSSLFAQSNPLHPYCGKQHLFHPPRLLPQRRILHQLGGLDNRRRPACGDGAPACCQKPGGKISQYPLPRYPEAHRLARRPSGSHLPGLRCPGNASLVGYLGP